MKRITRIAIFFLATMALVSMLAVFSQTFRPTFFAIVGLTPLTNAQEAATTFQDGYVWYNSDLQCIRKQTSGAKVCIASFGPGVVDCSTQAGATEGAQIQACIAALPSVGGVADASGISGGTIATDVFTAVTKNVTLKWGAGTHAFTLDTVIPANITQVFAQGSILAPATTKTLTINGDVQAPKSQIFGGAGVISFAINGILSSINPQWWSSTLLTGLTAAIASLPSNGAIDIDARGYAGSATIASTLTIDRPARILFGTITLTLSGSPGIYASAEGVEISGPSTAVLNYTGPGKAIQFGPDGLTVTTYFKKPYILRGFTLTGGASMTHGVYFATFIVNTAIHDTVFYNFGNSTAWNVFYQSSNWYNLIDGIFMWNTPTFGRAINGIKTNGTDLSAVEDFGQSRLVVTNSILQPFTAANTGIYVNAFNSVLQNVTISGGFQPNVQIASWGNGSVLDKVYMEAASGSSEPAIKYGDSSGAHVASYLTLLTIKDCYLNAHNAGGGGGGSTTARFMGPTTANTGLYKVRLIRNTVGEYDPTYILAVQNNNASQDGNYAEGNLRIATAFSSIVSMTGLIHTGGASIASWEGPDEILTSRSGGKFAGRIDNTADDGTGGTTGLSALFKNNRDGGNYIALQSGSSAEQYKGFFFRNKSDAIEAEFSVPGGGGAFQWGFGNPTVNRASLTTGGVFQVYNQVPSTGVTTLKARAGANQLTTSILQVTNNASDAETFGVKESGAFTAAGLFTASGGVSGVLGATGPAAATVTTLSTGGAVLLNGSVSQGTAFKFASITTGSIAGASSAAVTLTFSGVFTNSAWAPSCSLVEATTTTLTIRIHHIESITNTTNASITVRIVNDDAVTAKTGTLYCYGVSGP